MRLYQEESFLVIYHQPTGGMKRLSALAKSVMKQDDNTNVLKEEVALLSANTDIKKLGENL